MRIRVFLCMAILSVVVIFVPAEPGAAMTWTKEDGIRVTEGVSSSTIELPDGTWRMYYTGMGDILSATSTDGLNWTKEDGARISPGGVYDSEMAINPAVIKLPDGRYRIYYDGYDGTYRRIVSATSQDGINFTKDEGIRIDTSGDPVEKGTASVPDVISVPDGGYRMFYVYDMYGVNSIRSAVSDSEGLVWTKEDISGFKEHAMDPEVITLSDGTYTMFFTIGIPPDGPSIYTADSSDLVNWTVETEPIISPGGTNDAWGVVDADVVEVSDGVYRMYYGGTTYPIGGTFNILSAISGSVSGGGCFIATAAYGTPVAEEVRILCRFRDTYLVRNALGRSLVRLYGRLSPCMGDAIGKRGFLRTLVRLQLRPVVKLIRLFLFLSPG